MAEQEPPFNTMMEQKMRKAAEAGKAKRFPDYKGGNPNTPDEINRELQEQGVVKTEEFTKEDAGKILDVVKEQMNKQAAAALVAEQAAKEQVPPGVVKKLSEKFKSPKRKEVIRRDIKLGEDDVTGKPIYKTFEYDRQKLEDEARKRKIDFPPGTSLEGLYSLIEEHGKSFFMESPVERQKFYEKIRTLDKNKQLAVLPAKEKQDLLASLEESKRQINAARFSGDRHKEHTDSEGRSIKRNLTDQEKQELRTMDELKKLIENGKTAKPAVEVPAKRVEGKIEIPKEGQIRNSPAYKFIAQNFMLGMNYEDFQSILRRRERPYFVPKDVTGRDLELASDVFAKDIEEGNDPLARKAAELTLLFIKNYDQIFPMTQDEEGKLIAPTEAEAEKKFQEVAREVWQFAYGAKFAGDEPSQDPRLWDTDVKASMWLLQKAAFKKAEEAKGIAQGEALPNSLNIDTSHRSGFEIQLPAVNLKPFLHSVDTNQPFKASIDNHPEGRAFPTSAAKILYETLKRIGLLELDPAEQRAVDMMIKYSVDSDNATFPISREGKLKDFKKSPRTFLGLGRFMTGDQIYEYFQKNVAPGHLLNAYTAAVVERELTDEEIEKYGLNKKGKDDSESPLEQARSAVKQAEYLFDRKTDNELLKAGRMIQTKFGRYIVNVEWRQRKKERLLAGFQAAKAYGFHGYFSYREDKGFLLNTLDEGVDLSERFKKDEKLKALLDKQGVMVRGAMYIKPNDGENLKIRFREILDAAKTESYEPQGRVKYYLEREKIKDEITEKWETGVRQFAKKFGWTDKRVERWIEDNRIQNIKDIMIAAAEKESDDGGENA